MADYLPLIWSICIFALACAAAWGGAKYALSAMKAEQLELKKDFKELADDLKGRVTLDACRIDRVDCREIRKSNMEINGKRFDTIITMIEKEAEVRQTNYENNRTLINTLCNTVGKLKTMIDERSHRFRKQNGDDENDN